MAFLVRRSLYPAVLGRYTGCFLAWRQVNVGYLIVIPRNLDGGGTHEKYRRTARGALRCRNELLVRGLTASRNFCKDVTRSKSSEIVLQGEPFFFLHPLDDHVEGSSR
jgi:hypothetical protein